VNAIARRLLAPTAAAATAAALLVPLGVADARVVAPASARAGASVTVADMAFSPGTVTVAVGETVTWTFADAVPHTSTSDDGFWDSGIRSGGATYARKFKSAGTFAYHCTIHPMMRGRVRVPVTATGTPAKGWKLRWSTRKARGRTQFDVRVRRGSGPWKLLETDTHAAAVRFDPARAGVWRVRARTEKGAKRSGWSPVVTVKVS
jgi:plastocyanin